jgi:hypothetical protein
MYRKIINPKTNKLVNVNSKIGKGILNKYMIRLMRGGASPSPPYDTGLPAHLRDWLHSTDDDTESEIEVFDGRGAQMTEQHEEVLGKFAKLEGMVVKLSSAVRRVEGTLHGEPSITAAELPAGVDI